MASDTGPFLLGLDAGNTVIKAVLFDRGGRQVAHAARDAATAQPRPGFVERDIGELWSNACAAIRTCIAEAGVAPERIAGVGCAGHGNGLYLLDDAGNPVLGIQSLDTRAAATAERLIEQNGDALHAVCLQKPWPAQTATLLAWTKEHLPESYDRAATIAFCKDIITSRLTGARVSDVSDMSGGGLLRMPDGAYDPDLLDLYGLGDAYPKLPELVEPTSVAGYVTNHAAAATGLAEGTPVAGGLFDVIASAVGSGAARAGQASIIAGTWSINQVLSQTAVVDPAVFMVARFGPDSFASIDASATSAANLEWYVRTLVEQNGRHDDPFGYCNERLAEVAPAADDPIFHPYLYGSGESATARGGFYGLAGWHSEGHLLRALLEGVVFEHRRHIEVLTVSGVPFSAAIMSGGGTRSPHWPQIMADCLGVPITVADCAETGALGAAIAAGVGAGLFKDLRDGAATITRPRAVFQPAHEMKAHYDRRYELYRRLAADMSDFWAAQAALRQ